MPLPYVGPAPAAPADVATKAYADSVGGGGGGVTITQTSINIGSTAKTFGKATVTNAAVLPTSKIDVGWGNVTENSLNHPEFDQVTFLATPRTGNFVVTVISERPIVGVFNIQYFIVN